MMVADLQSSKQNEETIVRIILYRQWELIEYLQEEEPHLHWGWCGLVPMIILADNS